MGVSSLFRTVFPRLGTHCGQIPAATAARAGRLGIHARSYVDDVLAATRPVGIGADIPATLHTRSPGRIPTSTHECRTVPRTHNTYDYYDLHRSWELHTSSGASECGSRADRSRSSLVMSAPYLQEDT